MDGTQLHRFFWVVLSGLATSLGAIVLLVRSGRAVPGPMPGTPRAGRMPRT